MSRTPELHQLVKRLARGTLIPVTTHKLQSACSVIVRDYKLAPTNYMEAAKPEHQPFLCSVIPSYMHPIGKMLFPQAMVATYGSGFPVAPNILLTASHTVQDDTFIGAGYEISSIVSYQPHFDSKPLSCSIIPRVSRKVVEEKDPVTGASWILPNDYMFLRVQQPVPHQTSILLPKVARVGDPIVFPALRPNLQGDLHLVPDILFALSLVFQHGGLLEKEAEEHMKKIGIDPTILEKFAGTTNTLQSEGKVLKVAYGLIAHDSSFLRGMSGTFGSVASGTFSCVGISAGLGSIIPGSNYNVAVDINRADFKEDYAAIVLPHLPHNARLQAERFLNEK